MLATRQDDRDDDDDGNHDEDELETSEAWYWVGCCWAHRVLHRHVEKQRYEDDVGEDDP